MKLGQRAASVKLVPVAQGVAAAVVLARLARGRDRPAPLAPAELPVTGRTGDEPVRPRVSLVVPARDEAARIGPLLAAALDDPQLHEVIVVDDESADDTAKVATAAGARVVTGRPLPPGWVGKQWALRQGVEAASGDWVLTMDADARPHPGLAGALLAAAAGRGDDLLTAAPRFDCRTRGEQLLHPSMLATLVYRFGPPGPARPEAPGRVMANGQCMLFRRELLADGEVFAAIADRMTDDVALARELAGRGHQVGFLDASRLLTVRMHTTAGEVWREWGRSLALADVTPPVALAADLAVIWLTMALPPLRLLTGRGTRLDAALLAVRAALGVALAGSYERPRRWVPFAPLADPATAVRLTLSALRPARSWRGRHYATPSRQAGSAARSGP
jgi:dolichol-phosphate mannosyltransferase